jgi:hypothetical protein
MDWTRKRKSHEDKENGHGHLPWLQAKSTRRRRARHLRSMWVLAIAEPSVSDWPCLPTQARTMKSNRAKKPKSWPIPADCRLPDTVEAIERGRKPPSKQRALFDDSTMARLRSIKANEAAR